LGFSSRGSKAWTLSSHWAKIWLGLSLVLGVHNNNQQLLQYDNGQNAENRMLVFYSPESLERLANAQTFFIFMDGTFSVPPHPFKQLYTIRVPFKDVTGTAVVAFLPNKCQDTYRELFQCQVVETALVVDVATKYSCICTKNCIFKVWTLKCRLLAWQFKQ
jgi:hypothetical protein